MAPRPCACGGSGSPAGVCAECGTKKLLGQSLQPKLRINKPCDEYEQEAERVVEQVMRMPSQPGTSGMAQSSTLPLVQHRATGSPKAAAAAVPSIVQEVLATSGQPLDPATRDFFEPRFAHDFGQVRIHADTQAAKSAQAVNALAYTVGRDVVFATGTYAPRDPLGQRLLAHELSHVIQQGGSGPGSTLRRAPGAGVEPEKAPGPVSLSTGIAGTHEIVIDGKPYHLAVISDHLSAEDPATRFQAAAKDYVGEYPNLGQGLWAFIIEPGVVEPGNSPHCPIKGNCLGWAYGNFSVFDPSDRVWILLPKYFESIGLAGESVSPSVDTYLAQARAQRFPPHAIWDYFMSVEFQASPADSDRDAHLALYGRGFAGTMDGPSHIAFRTAGGELWVSKPSYVRFPVVHEQAGQMSGGQMGDIVRLYKRASGPLAHVVLRSRATPAQ